VDAAVAVLITTSSCRTQQPPLDMNDAFMTPITTPSPSCGIAPQPAARGIAPQTAFTLHCRPPSRMESTEPAPPPWIFGL
jgi:hypothetical protein